MLLTERLHFSLSRNLPELPSPVTTAPPYVDSLDCIKILSGTTALHNATQSSTLGTHTAEQALDIDTAYSRTLNQEPAEQWWSASFPLTKVTTVLLTAGTVHGREIRVQLYIGDEKIGFCSPHPGTKLRAILECRGGGMQGLQVDKVKVISDCSNWSPKSCFDSRKYLGAQHFSSEFDEKCCPFLSVTDISVTGPGCLTKNHVKTTYSSSSYPTTSSYITSSYITSSYITSSSSYSNTPQITKPQITKPQTPQLNLGLLNKTNGAQTTSPFSTSSYVTSDFGLEVQIVTMSSGQENNTTLSSPLNDTKGSLASLFSPLTEKQGNHTPSSSLVIKPDLWVITCPLLFTLQWTSFPF